MEDDYCNPGEHEWLAGMVVVHPEDVEWLASVRALTCNKCDKIYEPGD